MKESLLEVTSRLNNLGQGTFEYLEKEWKDPLPVLGDNRIHLDYAIFRKYPEQKVLFRNSYSVDLTEDLEIARTKLRELLLYNILVHSIFGIKGVIAL